MSANSKSYSLVLADGETVSCTSKKQAISRGEASGQDFMVASPSGVLVYETPAFADGTEAGSPADAPTDNPDSVGAGFPEEDLLGDPDEAGSQPEDEEGDDEDLLGEDDLGDESGEPERAHEDTEVGDHIVSDCRNAGKSAIVARIRVGRVWNTYYDENDNQICRVLTGTPKPTGPRKRD